MPVTPASVPTSTKQALRRPLGSVPYGCVSKTGRTSVILIVHLSALHRLSQRPPSAAGFAAVPHVGDEPTGGIPRRARGLHQGRSPKTIHPLDRHYLNLQRELHRTFQTLALAA